MKPWLAYLLVRLGIFGAVLAILLVLGVTPWIAAVIAAAIGLCAAYIFFRPLREQLVDSMRSSSPSADADDEHVEDAAS